MSVEKSTLSATILLGSAPVLMGLGKWIGYERVTKREREEYAVSGVLFLVGILAVIAGMFSAVATWMGMVAELSEIERNKQRGKATKDDEARHAKLSGTTYNLIKSGAIIAIVFLVGVFAREVAIRNLEADNYRSPDPTSGLPSVTIKAGLALMYMSVVALMAASIAKLHQN